MDRAPGKEDKLYLRVYNEIRQYIVQHHLKSGDMLPTEQKMCEALGVSRNVLREAIKSMELMGMVKACPGRGTEVRGFSLDFLFQNVLFFSVGEDEEKNIRDLFGLRRNLELEYMRQAFYLLSDEDIAHLRECVRLIRERLSDIGTFSDIDRDFHMTIFRPLNNQVLNALLETIWAIDKGFDLEKKIPHLAGTVSKHAAIVDALENKDYDGFVTAMHAHFSSGKYTAGGHNYEEY